jgi:hypothetical protein
VYGSWNRFCSIENGSTKQTKQRGSCVDIALLFSTKLKHNLFRKQKSKGRWVTEISYMV